MEDERNALAPPRPAHAGRPFQHGLGVDPCPLTPLLSFRLVVVSRMDCLCGGSRDQDGGFLEHYERLQLLRREAKAAEKTKSCAARELRAEAREHTVSELF
jgi:hypothetical protein